ncbi:hypothetical protein JTE90_018503 [Oedothorax gibbosus]|uniref:Uncharacterized protein n=1 Tax=Oedothorax gibbosus TaxID=931172 RepID=A0AAV6V1H9_9ARAC|nr:hypothetical protein JTE90_018503 [Oedothorax gibbosus]
MATRRSVACPARGVDAPVSFCADDYKQQGAGVCVTDEISIFLDRKQLSITELRGCLQLWKWLKLENVLKTKESFTC